ncbi:MAG: PqqD family protein [Defluviitaleaceae bacterium]|nr:PqqD family protein [Defluviitaleaceae bacterium]
MKLNNNLIYRFEDGIIFDTSQGVLHELNETGNEILKLLDENNSYNQIIEILVSKYNLSEKSQIIEFVDEAFESFKEKGILHE